MRKSLMLSPPYSPREDTTEGSTKTYWEKHLRSTKHLRRPLPPRWEDPPVEREQEKATVGASTSQSPGAGSARSRSVQGQEPLDKPRLLMLPQTEEAQGRHSISDTANARCKTSSDGKETQG